jgi:polysaccharide biosynthesis transport protein
MRSSEAGIDQGGDLDVAGLVQAVRRRRLAILLPTLLAFAAAVWGVNWVTPRYTADTRILLESRDGYFTRPGGALAGDRADALDDQHVQSQVLLITSRDLVRGVVDRLGLDGTEFDPAAQEPGSIARVLSLVFGAMKPADIREDRVDRFLDRVTVYAAARSRVITIEVSAQDPELAARAANALADAYVEALGGAKQDTVRVAGSWLQNTIEPLRQKLLEAEAKVEEYRARTGLLVGSNNSTIQQLQLAEISAQLSTARTAEADSRAKAELLKEAIRAGRSLEISEVANNDLVRRLLSERATVRGQIALESRTLLSGHPRMKELNAQLAEIEQQIRQAAEKAVRALENDSKVAGSRVQTLTAAMNDRKRDSAQANEDDVQLRALEREAKSQREQLEAYMTRYREAVAREGNDAIPADARIISRAIAPVTPTFPKKLPVVLVATLATFLLSLALVVTRQLMTIGAPAPATATVPLGRTETLASASTELKPEPAFVALAPPQAHAAHAPREGQPTGAPSQPDPDAKARLEPGRAEAQGLHERQTPPERQTLPERQISPDASTVVPAHRMAAVTARQPAIPASRAAEPQVAAVTLAGLAETVAGTPSAPGQGVLALCLSDGVLDVALPLARLLARRLRVVLVDAQSQGEAARPGFAEAVAGSASFFEIIQRDGGSRLHCVAPGSPAAQEASKGQIGADILDALRHAYDVVILALSPERMSDEVAGLVDIVLCAGAASDLTYAYIQELGQTPAICVGTPAALTQAVA